MSGPDPAAVRRRIIAQLDELIEAARTDPRMDPAERARLVAGHQGLRDRLAGVPVAGTVLAPAGVDPVTAGRVAEAAIVRQLTEHPDSTPSALQAAAALAVERLDTPPRGT